MKKRYLKTVEDFLAYKDTDTKIYNSCSRTVAYFQFVNGYFCRFDKNGEFLFNVDIDVNGQDFYILEEEPVQKVTASDIGGLVKFWDYDEENEYKIAILKGIVNNYGETVYYDNVYGECCWKNCRRLTPSEVEELTGYKVEKAE